MGLVKEKDNPTGATSTYWIVSRMDINKISESGNIKMYGYQDRETRLQYPSQGVIEEMNYSVPTEDFRELFDRIVLDGANMFVQAYRYIKGVEKGSSDSILNPVFWTDSNGNLSWFHDAEDRHEVLEGI